MYQVLVDCNIVEVDLDIVVVVGMVMIAFVDNLLNFHIVDVNYSTCCEQELIEPRIESKQNLRIFP